MDWYDELNGAFNARKRAEAEAARTVANAEKEGAGKAARLMEALILPVLQECSDHIRRQGQTSEVNQRFRPKGPLLEFLFSPAPFDSSRLRQASVLRFVSDGDGFLSLEKEINSPQGESKSLTGRRRWPVAEISENFIRTEIKAFIATVLDVH